MVCWRSTRLLGKNTDAMAIQEKSHTEPKISFVARFWLEGPEKNLVWRGHLRQVQGDEECYFQSFSAMKAFLERVSGVQVLMNGDAGDQGN